MKETELKNVLAKKLERVDGVWPTPVTPGPMGRRGVSDLLLCIEGRFAAIELKLGTNKPTKLQARYLRKIAENGGFTTVAYSEEEVMAWVNRVKTEIYEAR